MNKHCRVYPPSFLPSVMYTVCHVYPPSCLPSVMYTLRHLYPSSCIPSVVYTSRREYPPSCIPPVFYTHRHGYPPSCIPSIMYTLCRVYLPKRIQYQCSNCLNIIYVPVSVESRNSLQGIRVNHKQSRIRSLLLNQWKHDTESRNARWRSLMDIQKHLECLLTMRNIFTIFLF